MNRFEIDGFDDEFFIAFLVFLVFVLDLVNVLVRILSGREEVDWTQLRLRLEV